MTSRRGFSLVELLVAMAISLIIGSAIILFLVSQTQLTATQNRNMVNAEEVRGVLTFMTDEMQMMGNRVPEPFIDVAQAQDLQFYSDIDNDGKRDRIRYTVVGRQLRRTLSTSPDGIVWTVVGTDTLIDDLRTGGEVAAATPGFAFTYFGFNDTVPATTAAITSIQVVVGIWPDAKTTAFTKGRIAQQNMVQRATVRNRTL